MHTSVLLRLMSLPLSEDFSTIFSTVPSKPPHHQVSKYSNQNFIFVTGSCLPMLSTRRSQVVGYDSGDEPLWLRSVSFCSCCLGVEQWFSCLASLWGIFDSWVTWGYKIYKGDTLVAVAEETQNGFESISFRNITSRRELASSVLEGRHFHGQYDIWLVDAQKKAFKRRISCRHAFRLWCEVTGR